MSAIEPVDVTKVVVISPSAKLAMRLSADLPEHRFSVVNVRPGPGVLRTLYRERPQIAVVDGIDERPEAAQLEIALTKELCPTARIIALSGDSSPADARVLEQGIFYYTTAISDGELVRIVCAAERAAAGHSERHQ